MKSPHQYLADYSVMEKFSITENKFPQETIFINPQPQFYKDHTVAIWMTVAVQQSTEGVTQISKIVRSMKQFSPPGEDNKVSLNIIVNAAHAITSHHEKEGLKGVISIATRQNENFVEIAISDNGGGTIF